MPVGLSRQPYEETLIQLEPGDRLFFYSDGVTETMNPARELFGEERLIRTLVESCAGSVEDALTFVLYELQAWRETVPLGDDVTLLGCALPDTGAESEGSSEEDGSPASR
jgi:sigma-B regulation protein RsbU (phosphoserine phosphatase)